MFGAGDVFKERKKDHLGSRVSEVVEKGGWWKGIGWSLCTLMSDGHSLWPVCPAQEADIRVAQASRPNSPPLPPLPPPLSPPLLPPPSPSTSLSLSPSISVSLLPSNPSANPIGPTFTTSPDSSVSDPSSVLILSQGPTISCPDGPGFLLTTFCFHYVFVGQSLSCVLLCNPTDCSTPGFPVLHHLPELAQTHVH